MTLEMPLTEVKAKKGECQTKCYLKDHERDGNWIDAGDQKGHYGWKDKYRNQQCNAVRRLHMTNRFHFGLQSPARSDGESTTEVTERQLLSRYKQLTSLGGGP